MECENEHTQWLVETRYTISRYPACPPKANYNATDSLLLCNDLVFDLFVRRSREDVFLHQLILARIRTPLNNFLRIGVTYSWQRFQLVSSRRVNVEQIGLVSGIEMNAFADREGHDTGNHNQAEHSKA